MYVEFPFILSQSFLLKKNIGLSFCDRTAPIATPDASVVISNGSEKFGSANVISCDIAVLSDWNAFAAFSFQLRELGFIGADNGSPRRTHGLPLTVNEICGEVILGLEYPIEWIGSIKCGKEYLRVSRLVLLWRNGWWRWWRWGQLSLFGICEHGGEIVYGIGLVCHGGGLCGDVTEEGGGQLDEGLDIGGGG
nr:hypothetical protein [Tanacetum cinerariifolium]